jgi:hypothetical protein
VTTLAEQIEARAPALAARALEQMYRNPFWHERFGERGRRFAQQDGEFHLSYLVQALTAGDPRVLTGYARWLQPVLTTRGMCTLHIDDNFARLACVLGDEIAEAAPAIAMLEAARDALRYNAGPARDLQEAAPRVADTAAGELYRRHPDWESRWGDAGRDRCCEDLRYHLSYLADAIALDRGNVFTAYVEWIGGFLERRGVAIEHLRESLQVMRDVVLQQHDLAAAAPPVQTLIGRAVERLG